MKLDTGLCPELLETFAVMMTLESPAKFIGEAVSATAPNDLTRSPIEEFDNMQLDNDFDTSTAR